VLNTGNFEDWKWLYLNEYLCDGFCFSYSAGYGYLNIMNWLLQNNLALDYACKNENIDILKLLYEME
jgi:hypothetical protein